MAIIISQDGKNAHKIDRSDFEKEDYLQNYIHENPESIPVYEIEEDKKLFVVAREFPTESGPIDALAIDKDGDIYVVETKLYKNPDKRTVVAQALDYGASLWRHSDYGDFIKRIDDVISRKFKISFEDKIKSFFNIEDEQVEFVFETMRINLQQGNIKFVILMDSIDERLKDLIVYVNQNSQFDIYAVQIEYYKFESYEIIIPKLFGVEVKKNVIVAGKRTSIQDEEYFNFYKELIEMMPDKNYRQPQPRAYYQIPTGIGGIHFEWSFHKLSRSFGVELHFEKPKGEINKELISRIEEGLKDRLEQTFEEDSVVFEKDWGEKWSRICVLRKNILINEELKVWAVEKMKIFMDIIQPELDKIK
ncbi:MAG: DUF4268 domain-containing protein [Bacilli bacterium]|nr:DUF4268 domain-containing protein [Bacilli bacterium]